MGATIFPAIEAPYETENGTTGWYLESVAPRQTVVDEQFGTFEMAEEGYELHLTYGSVYRILDALGYDWDPETYSGSYDIVDFMQRLTTARVLNPSERLDYLNDIVRRGMGLGATHIAWG